MSPKASGGHGPRPCSAMEAATLRHDSGRSQSMDKITRTPATRTSWDAWTRGRSQRHTATTDRPRSNGHSPFSDASGSSGQSRATSEAASRIKEGGGRATR